METNKTQIFLENPEEEDSHGSQDLQTIETGSFLKGFFQLPVAHLVVFPEALFEGELIDEEDLSEGRVTRLSWLAWSSIKRLALLRDIWSPPRIKPNMYLRLIAKSKYYRTAESLKVRRAVP